MSLPFIYMIKISDNLAIPERFDYGSVDNGFRLIKAYLEPVRNAPKRRDSELFIQGQEAIRYFTDRMNLNLSFFNEESEIELNNGRFIRLVECIWDDLELNDKSLFEEKSNLPLLEGRDLAYRLDLEEAAVRLLDRRNIIDAQLARDSSPKLTGADYVSRHLFRGQQIFSIFACNPAVLSRKLEPL